jgi:hypothetical protein
VYLRLKKIISRFISNKVPPSFYILYVSYDSIPDILYQNMICFWIVSVLGKIRQPEVATSNTLLQRTNIENIKNQSYVTMKIKLAFQAAGPGTHPTQGAVQ